MACNLKNDVERILGGSDKQVEPHVVEAVSQAIKEYKKQERAIDEQRATEETATVMGSMDMDEQIARKIQDGTYKKIDEMSMTLSLVKDNIQGLVDYEYQNAHERGYKIDAEHYNYVSSFIKSVSDAMSNIGMKDVTHKFEMYETDEEYSMAFWKDDLHGGGLNGDVHDSGKIVVLKGKDAAGGPMISNNAELVAHEFSHSATELALRQDGRLNRQVAKIQREVMKKLTAADLLSHIPEPTVAQQVRAEELLRYMNSDPSEFLAYFVSNQQVFNAMKNMEIKIDTFKIEGGPKNGFTKTIDMMKEIINRVISLMTNGPTAAIAMNNVVQELVAKNMQIKAKMYTGEVFDDYASKVTGGKYEKIDTFMKEGSSRIEDKIKSMQIMSPRTKDQIVDFVDTMSDIKFIRDLRESGVVQNIMHTMFRATTDKEFAASFQLIRQVKTDNDKFQNSLKEVNANLVHSWFKDVAPEQREAITDLLNADVNALGMNRAQLAKLLDDSASLDSMIEELKTSIGVNEYLHQARDLGWYMMQGTSKNPLLQTNAHRIYHRMYGGVKQAGLGKGSRDEMVGKIDRLATLYAMKYIDNANKKHIVKLLRDESAVALSNDVTDKEQYHVADLAMTLYKTSYENEMADFGDVYSQLMDKGYMRKAHKLPMKTRIVPEELLAEQEKRGYDRKQAVFSQAATDMRGDGKRYYVMFAPDYSVSRTQGAIHDIGYFDKVQQMSDIYDGHNVAYERNAQLVEQKMIQNRLYRGFDAEFKELDTGSMMQRQDQLMAVLKMDGSVADYSVPIGRADSENHMMEDRDIASALAATVTHRSAKGKAIRGNISVINHLLVTEIEHEDDPDYVVLRRSNDVEKLEGKPYKYDKEYAMIPEYTRDYINIQRKKLGLSGEANSIRIHKDMINDFIGYKDASLAEFSLGENGKYFDIQNHPSMALQAERLQYWLKKMIARYKTILVILNPAVIFGNAISNFNMATVHGIDPITYTKLFTRYWKHLDEYNEIHNDLLRTESEMAAGVKGLNNRIDGLRKQLKANPMHELMEDGQFNMIIEDIDSYSNKEDHVEYQKRRLMEKALGKEGASKAREAVDAIVLTKGATQFKMIEKLTTYNDIVNRAIVMEKLKWDMARDIADGNLADTDDARKVRERENLNYVDQLFVNYSYLDNRYIKYANDMGLILFTKYFFRALKTLKQVYDKKPLSMTLFLGLEGADLMPSMFDENPYKNYADPAGAIVNRLGPVAGLDFMEMMKKVLTPASFQII